MPNPDPRTSHLRKLVSAARAVVTYQVGLPIGCERISKILHWLRPYDEVHYPVFGEYMEATTGLPLGTERLECSWEALRRFDVRLEAVNREYRDRVFDACYDMLDQFGEPDARGAERSS